MTHLGHIQRAAAAREEAAPFCKSSQASEVFKGLVSVGDFILFYFFLSPLAP